MLLPVRWLSTTSWRQSASRHVTSRACAVVERVSRRATRLRRRLLTSTASDLSAPRVNREINTTNAHRSPRLNQARFTRQQQQHVQCCVILAWSQHFSLLKRLDHNVSRIVRADERNTGRHNITVYSNLEYLSKYYIITLYLKVHELDLHVCWIQLKHRKVNSMLPPLSFVNVAANKMALSDYTILQNFRLNLHSATTVPAVWCHLFLVRTATTGNGRSRRLHCSVSRASRTILRVSGVEVSQHLRLIPRSRPPHPAQNVIIIPSTPPLIQSCSRRCNFCISLRQTSAHLNRMNWFCSAL